MHRLFQIHGQSPRRHEEGWTELAAAERGARKVRGRLFNFNVAKMERATAFAPITSLQPPIRPVA